MTASVLSSDTRRTAPASDGAALIVDARMLFLSGIGRYLREILARWPVESGPGESYVCNGDEQVEWLRAKRPGARIIRANAGIYGLREQWLALRFPADAVYWVPHYNVPALSRARLVATVHDIGPLVLTHIYPGRVRYLVARQYFRSMRRLARRVITVSHFTADELSRHTRIAREAVTVIPNGVDDVWHSDRDTQPRVATRLLFVGNFKAHKNVGRLLDAVERVRRDAGLDVTLDVVGQTTGFRAGLEASTAGRVNGAPWVRVHGRADDATLRGLYASAGALVFPSVYEGFGLPMLEAMAAGCPVLASTAGSLVEIGGADRADGGGVMYFDAGDVPGMARQIERFCRLPEEARARMGAFGRQLARRYSWAVAARDTRAVLVASGRGRVVAGAGEPWVRPSEECVS